MNIVNLQPQQTTAIIMKILIFLLFLLAPAIAFAADISLVIQNLRSDQGAVFAGFFDKPDSFPGTEFAVGCISKERIANGKVTIKCTIDPGSYAVAIFHDENSNGEFDRNFLGIPKEGYGFSRNPELKMRPPDFTEALFEVGEVDLEMTIQMRY